MTSNPPPEPPTIPDFETMRAIEIDRWFRNANAAEIEAALAREEEIDDLISGAQRMARRMGGVFLVDPDKRSRFASRRP